MLGEDLLQIGIFVSKDVIVELLRGVLRGVDRVNFSFGSHCNSNGDSNELTHQDGPEVDFFLVECLDYGVIIVLDKIEVV